MKELGYCGMTADYLHIGHINFLNICKSYCKRLIVGVMSDESVLGYKGKYPTMKQGDRRRIIDNLSMVDATFIQDTFDFPDWVISLKEAFLGEFVIFDTEEHKRLYADIIIPRTAGISSSMFKELNDDSNYRQHTL